MIKQIFGCCMLLSLAGCGYEQIPPASVGVLFDGNTGISQSVISSRLMWVGPFQQLIVYPTATKQAAFVRHPKQGDKAGDDAIQAMTIEGATLPMDVTLEYHVDPANVLTAFKEFGTADLQHIQHEYLRWAVISAVNIVSGQRSIFDLMSKERTKIGPLVRQELKPTFDAWGITIDNVYLGQVYASAEIQGKIDESVTVHNELEKAKIAQQQASVEAQTTMINAQKVAQQNHLLASQGEKSVRQRKIELRRQAIAQWDGESPDTGDGTIPFTNGMSVGR